ncbi:hypothetical protein EV175_001103, partial [Coemansia sp. RSA 1933]
MTHSLAWRRMQQHISGAAMRTYSFRCWRSTLKSTAAQLPRNVSSGQDRGLILTLAGPTQFRRYIETHNASDRDVERHLLDSMYALTLSESLVNREAVWGAYVRVTETRVGVAFLSPQILIRLVEQLSNDPDKSRALARISSVTDAVGGVRELSAAELDAIQQACEAAESPDSKSTSEIADPSTATNKIRTIPDDVIPKREELPSLPAAFLRRVDETTESDLPMGRFKAQTLLNRPLITLDTAHVWKAYVLDLDASVSDDADRLSYDSVYKLIDYCSQVGCVTGAALLKWIEIDADTNPWLFPNIHERLIVAYAKLGMLGHSRRCHRDGLAALEGRDATDIDWSLCVALLRSMQQKEAHAIFDKIVAAGRVNNSMYSMMIREYTIMNNPAAAFALFDDMCNGDFKPDYATLCALGTAAALYKDAAQSTDRIQRVAIFMKNWGIPADWVFFIHVLKGYSQSQQYVMFDSLAKKLLDRLQYSTKELNQVLLTNAVKRGDHDLAWRLAPPILENINTFPRYEKALRRMGRPEELRRLLDLSRFPENNFTANMRLSLDIGSAGMVLEPKALLHSALDMVEKGFTPSFVLFTQLVRQLSVCGSQSIAIQAFEKLSAAGVPRSIELLLFLHRLYLNSRARERAIGIFADIQSRLAHSNLGSIKLHAPTMRRYIRYLIERREMAAAHDALTFIQSLPCNHKELPYSPLIEYYISRGMSKESRNLIAHVVQHDIVLEPRVISLCCRDLMENATTTDCANFLRYVHRIGMIDSVPYTVFEALVLRFIQENKVSDIEWAVGMLVNSPYENIGVWRAIFKRLAKSSGNRTVGSMVYTAVDLANNKRRIGMQLLEAAAHVPHAVVVADRVLGALREHRVHVDQYFYTMAFSIFVRLWARHYAKGKAYARQNPQTSREYLISVFERHIHDAVKAGIDIGLVSVALRALTSSSSSSSVSVSKMSLVDYVDILKSIPDPGHSERAVKAVCSGFSQGGHVREVETLLDMMWKQGFSPATNMLNIAMSCFVHIPPPSSSRLVDNSAYADDIDTMTPEETAGRDMAYGYDDYGYTDESGEDRQSMDQDLRMMPRTDVDGRARRLAFYERCLSKVLSFWRQFKVHSLSPDHVSYSVLLDAFIKAERFGEAEELIDEMIDSGLGHSEHTAGQWIVLLLKEGDAKEAMSVLGAIDNKDACDGLSQANRRYTGLGYIRRNALHFLPFVTYYLKVGEHNHATKMLLAMHMLHLKASTHTYSHILVSLANDDNRQAFLDVVRQMVEFDIPVDDQVVDILSDYSTHAKHSQA